MAKANTPSNTPNPWERQEKETPKAFLAFTKYRELGPFERSTAKVAEAIGRSQSLVEQWCTKYGWVRRAAAWDDEVERQTRELALQEQLESIKEMRKRHTKVAEKMIKKADKALDQLSLEDIKPSDISKLVDSGSKLERISRGDVGDVIEERQGEVVVPAVTFYMPDNGRDRDDEDEE